MSTTSGSNSAVGLIAKRDGEFLIGINSAVVDWIVYRK